MDRPKRATRQPVKYCDEETPVKRKRVSIKSNSKENIDSEEVVTDTKPEEKSAAVVVEDDEEIVEDEVEEVASESSDESSEDLQLNTAPRVIQPQGTVACVARNTSGKYEAQYSKTSNAACRTCKDKITKGAFRIGKEVHIEYGNFGGGMGMGWWHMLCFCRQHTHTMKWKDFNGIEDLSLEDQKTLHLKACQCPMPVELLANSMVTCEAVQVENQEAESRKAEQKNANRQEAAAAAAARVKAVKDSSVEDLIRESVEKVIAKKTVDELKNIVKGNGLAVERGTGGKGKKKGAPKKADYQDAIINAEPLCKIGSLVKRAIRKHIKVDELKVLLENAGLPKTGSKTELTKRLLDHLGGDFGEESEEEKKSKTKKIYGFDYDSDDYEFTGSGIYKKDEPHPEIVVSARSGDLDSVKEILHKTTRPIATVNASRKWTEVEQKWGYDKSWDWHSETPLLASSENGHVEVVHHLLTNEADPTLEGCTACDTTESPVSAVKKKIASLTNDISKLKTNTYIGSYMFSATSMLTKLKKFEIIKQMLDTAGVYWDRANYAGPSYFDERKQSFARQPNKPRNSEQLQTALAAISRDATVDAAAVREIETRLKEAREKEAERRAAELQERKEREKREREIVLYGAC